MLFVRTDRLCLYTVEHDVALLLSFRCQTHSNALIQNITHFSGTIIKSNFLLVPVLNNHISPSSPFDTTFCICHNGGIIITTDIYESMVSQLDLNVLRTRVIFYTNTLSLIKSYPDS